MVTSINSVSPAFAVMAASSDKSRYDICLDMAERTPDRAINEALIWQNEQGGIPARHCEALGLFYLKEYREAAARLEKIAEDMRIGRGMPTRRGTRQTATASMLADMYAQAANAWLLADEIAAAETAIDIAMSLSVNGSSQELELLIDRARIAAADEDFALALKDLQTVQNRDPGRKNILVLIAAAARGSGQLVLAEQALNEYQSLFPNDIDGHLERGNLHDVLGNLSAARISWRKVLELSEMGPSADAARANLERIDLAGQ